MYIVKILVVVVLALVNKASAVVIADFLESTERNIGEPSKEDPRIVGGWQTNIAYFPYQVSVQRFRRHICGGSLLTNSIIITAAHCVLNSTQPDIYAIRAGSSWWSAGGTYMGVSRIMIHEKFNQPTHYNNDIALVVLLQPLITGSTIQPISLVALTDFVDEQETLYISGWGSTDMSKVLVEPILRYSSIFQINNAVCRANLAAYGKITDSMLCASNPFDRHDSCQGDSGGPLVVNVAGQLKLYGIVSWGLGCGMPRFPGVYTRIIPHTEWIKTTLASYS